MIINDYKIDFPPYSLSNNEPVRIIAEQDGEKLVSLDTFYGYTHKGIEKMLENRTYAEGMFYFEYLTNFDRISNLYAYTALIEEALGLDVPIKTEFLRLIILEMARITNHLKSLKEIASILDIGEMVKITTLLLNKISKMLYTGKEKAIFILGVHDKFKNGFISSLSKFLKDDLNDELNKIANIFKDNRLFIKRLTSLGVISLADAKEYGLSGVNLRASGINYDARVNSPYSAYSMFKIFVPTANENDCFTRYRLRLEEIFSSVILINDAINKMPLGDYIYKNEKIISIVESYEDFKENIVLEKGFYQKSIENPKGDFTINLFSDGKFTPKRVKISAPSLNSLLILEKICKNHFVSDIPIILNSLDISFGEVDR